MSPALGEGHRCKSALEISLAVPVEVLIDVSRVGGQGVTAQLADAALF